MERGSKQKRNEWVDLFWRSHHYNERTKLKSGQFLSAFCPYCGKELTWDNKTHLEAVNDKGEVGELELSPYLNVFEHRTDLAMPGGDSLADLRCPHCQASLLVDTPHCPRHHATAAGFLVASSSYQVPFFICTVQGCPWHALSPEDETTILLDDSDEW